MEMEEKKNMNTTRDMFKMALAVEYMKAVVSDASWIPAVCEAHNVVDRLHIQSKTVVCPRGVKPLSAVRSSTKSAQRISAAILHGLFAEKKHSGILTGNTPVPNPHPRQSKEDARQENADEEQEQQDLRGVWAHPELWHSQFVKTLHVLNNSNVPTLL